MLRTNILLLTFLFMLPVLAFAQPKIEINISAEKEITVNENGKDVIKRVAAEDADPQSILFYTLNYANSGDETAQNVAIVDPIPENTVYIAGSATGAGTEITFSIDNGKSYKKPSLLTYEVKNPDGTTEKNSASPEQYTHIRWLVESIPSGEKGEVSFQVTVK